MCKYLEKQDWVLNGSLDMISISFYKKDFYDSCQVLIYVSLTLKSSFAINLANLINQVVLCSKIHCILS